MSLNIENQHSKKKNKYKFKNYFHIKVFFFQKFIYFFVLKLFQTIVLENYLIV